VTVIIASVSVTYFIGTSRWCREVAEVDPQVEPLAEKSKRLKGKAFPCAHLTIFSVLSIVASGAFCDPATRLGHTSGWIVPHVVVTVIGILLIAWCFVRQARLIQANAIILDDIKNTMEESNHASMHSTSPPGECYGG
jgi:hypothetical protein